MYLSVELKKKNKERGNTSDEAFRRQNPKSDLYENLVNKLVCINLFKSTKLTKSIGNWQGA